MMKTTISPREWEALSAYLDGQLGPKDRDRLETRLKGNRELQSALEDLRRTRIVLRSQPRLRAPRNFTLTPEMVGQRSAEYRAPAPFFSTLRLVSALATVLLVIVLIGDFFSHAPAASQSQSAAVPMASTDMAMQAAPAAGSEAGAASAKLAPSEAETPAEGLGAAQITEQPLAGAARIMSETPTEMPPAAGTVGLGGGSPPTDTPGVSQPPAAAQALPLGTAPTEQAPLAASPSHDYTTQPTAGPVESTPEAPAPPAASIAVAPATQGENAAPNPYPLVEPGQRAGRLSNPGVLRALEIGLGFLAVLSGLVAYYLRRPHGS